MSLRARNRRHRSRGSVGKRITAVLLGLLSLIVVAIGGLTVWVLNVAADAPDIDTLQARRRRRQLADLRRRRQQPRLRRFRHPPRAGRAEEDPQGSAGGDDRDRGLELLRAQRRRRGRDLPRRRRQRRGRRGPPGRLDDHPAARPQPLHRRPPGQHRAQDPRGGDGAPVRDRAHQGPHPQRVSEHRHLRHQRRQVGRRRAGRRRGLLRQGRPGSRPARVGAARRPAAGAVGVQPVHQPQRRHRAPQRGARRDGRPGLHHARQGREGRRTPVSACSAARSTRRATSRSSSTSSRTS